MKYVKCDLNTSVRSNNAGKGNRQNGPVTSGKGLALRAGSVGLHREACSCEVGWRSMAASSPLVRTGVGGVCQRRRTAECRCVDGRS